MFESVGNADAIVISIATLIAWGLSFVGVSKYMRTHSMHKDNGFLMMFAVFVSMVVGITTAIASELVLSQTTMFESIGNTDAIVISIATLIAWGLSFVGVSRYMRAHSMRKDNGFLMMFAVFVSMVVGITTATASEFALSQTATSNTGLVASSNIVTAIVALIVWGIAFVGINRYLKRHSPNRDNGFYILLSTGASLGLAIIAAAAASRIPMTLGTPTGVTPVDLALFAIFLIVLTAPFKVKLAEKNLEAFLFVMGVLAVTVTSKWGMDLVVMAFSEPILKGIVPAVLVAGLIFFYGKNAFKGVMNRLTTSVPMPVLVFLVVFICGMISSVITAIITSLFLVEIVNVMPMERKDKINLVILACFSIGLGAVLTPLGEPLSTIAITKLSGAPYYAGFWYLFDQLGVLVILGCLITAAFSAFYVGRRATTTEIKEIADEGGVREVFIRAVKVYFFVAALFFLGAGMEVLIFKYFTQVPSQVLYWVNTVSAILDNATLTAAEIGPALTQTQINAALMGLLIFGGCLIPGNIPNIISAGKLGITSSEYAKLGVPFGFVLGALFFVLIFVAHFTPTLGIGA